MKTFCRCATLVLPLMFSACSEPTAPLAGLELHHPSGEVTVTQRITVYVSAFDAAMRQVGPPPLQWSSDDPSIATVDQAGVVTGQSVGSTRIRAAGAGMEASLEIEVQTALLSVATQTGSNILLAGEKAVIGVQLRAISGVPISAGRGTLFRWSTPDTDVVRIEARSSPTTLEVTAIGSGLAEIFADVGGVRGSMVFAVPTVGPDESPFRATAFTFVSYYQYRPSIQFTVVPGNNVELVRLEIALPGADPSFPQLCSSASLLAGTHDILGTDNSPVVASRNLANPFVDGGLALLTYRADDGRIESTAFTGGITGWDFDFITSGLVPWEVCSG